MLTRLCIFVFTFLFIYLSGCTENTKINNSADGDVSSMGKVLLNRPDSNLSPDSILNIGTDSATVTINDSLYFFGYVNNASVITKLNGKWVLGANEVGNGFGLFPKVFDTAGVFNVNFIIFDEVGNSDTSTVYITVTNDTPFVKLLLSDTLVKKSDSLMILFASEDDGNILKSSFACVEKNYLDTSFIYSDTIRFTALFDSSGKHTLVASVLDDDSNSSSDTAIVYVNSKPDSVVLKTPPQNATDQILNPVFSWSGFDHDNYDTSLSYTLIIIRQGNSVDTVISGKKTTVHTLTEKLLEGENINWFVIAEDFLGEKTMSDTFNFTTHITSGPTEGSVKGKVFREGKSLLQENEGIRVTAYGGGVQKGVTTTDSSGYFIIDNLKGSILLTFESYGFKAESTLVSILAGDTVSISEDSLTDTLAPIIVFTNDTTVKSGSSINLSWNASDTFYYVDSVWVDFGEGFTNVSKNDSLVKLNTFGDHTFSIKAIDCNGNVSEDSVTVHVNYPPDSISLIVPVSNAKIAVNSSPIFKWSCFDNDNKSSIRYWLYIGETPDLGDSSLKAENSLDSVYTLASSGSNWQTYYWKVIAFDGFDSVSSAVDSFSVGEYSTGRLEGFAFLQGMKVHNGIKLQAQSQIDTVSYIINVQSDGSFFADILPRTYTMTATDTLFSAFKSAATTVQVISGDTVHSDTLILVDEYLPHIKCDFPGDGDTLDTLSSARAITLIGTFEDTCSQVNPDSVKITLRDISISNATVSPSNWSFESGKLADGDYTLFIEAKDGAGNADTLIRKFYVNSKQITSSQNIDHDTMVISTNVYNVLPGIAIYYMDYNADGTWEDSLKTSSVSIQNFVSLDDYALTTSGSYIVKAVDSSGMSVSDTVLYTIGSDEPVADAGKDTSIYMGDSLLLHGMYIQKFGHAKKIEWKIDNGVFVETSSPDTMITLPNRYRSSYKCVFKVTDDNGFFDEDTISVTVGKEWALLGGAPVSQSGTGSYEIDVDFNGIPYVAYTDTVGSNKSFVYVKKYDGLWSNVGASAASDATAEYVDLAIGSGFGGTGQQYATYYVSYKQRYTPTKIIVKKFNGSSWVTDADTNEISGTGYYDMAISPMSVYPSIAYRDARNSDLGVVKYKDYSYNWVQKGGALASSWYDVISMDRGGNTVFYANLGVYRVSKYSSSWNTITISGFIPRDGELLDQSQYGNTNIYVSYSDAASSNKLSVKSYNGTVWNNVGTLGMSDGEVYTHTIVRDNDRSQDVYIAYFDYIDGTGSLSVKFFDGNDWVSVGTSGFATQSYTYPAKIVVKSGKIYVAYKDFSNFGKLSVMVLK